MHPLRAATPAVSMTWVTNDQFRWLGKVILAFAPLAGLVLVIWGPIRTDTAFAMLWAVVAVVMALCGVLIVYAQRRGPSVHR